MKEDQQITANQLAEITKEAYHTIQHWTTMGLLKVIKIRGRTRYYDKTDSVQRCQKIRALQNERYGLALIAKRLEKDA